MSSSILPPGKLAFHITEVMDFLSASRGVVQRLIDTGRLNTLPGMGKTMVPRASLEAYVSGQTKVTRGENLDRRRALLVAEYNGLPLGTRELLSASDYCDRMDTAINDGRRAEPWLTRNNLGDPETLSQYPDYDSGGVILGSGDNDPDFDLDEFVQRTRPQRNREAYEEFESMGFRQGECSFEQFLQLKNCQKMREVLDK